MAQVRLREVAGFEGSPGIPQMDAIRGKLLTAANKKVINIFHNITF